MAASTKLCLNMMVKNEAQIIVNTLKNLTDAIHFDYWVISDTGSTDNTKQLILEFFKEKDLKGEIIDDVWKNYSYNRTKSMAHAFNKSDYLIVFHPDDIIEEIFELPSPITKDVYYLKLRTSHFSFERCLLLNNRLKWVFKGELLKFCENRILNYSSRSLQNRVESIIALKGEPPPSTP
jgi:glycosyltransferase involved in cell wall biosynthesis